jgi:hypothetical protein
LKKMLLFIEEKVYRFCLREIYGAGTMLRARDA